MTAPIVLITGASRGIGAATARLAAKRGFDVAISYLKDRASAESVVAEVAASGRRAVAVQADMGLEDDIERMFATVDAQLGRITHLVYNTGITGPSSRIETLVTKDAQEVLAVNVLGAVLFARAGTMDEVAEAVVFLLSEASTYTTGAVLRVAGGR